VNTDLHRVSRRVSLRGALCKRRKDLAEEHYHGVVDIKGPPITFLRRRFKIKEAT